MTPNVDFYGQPEGWTHVLPLSGYSEDNKNLIPSWGTIGTAISRGILTANQPIDTSICYAAIAQDAPAATVSFCKESDVDNPTVNIPDKEDFFISYGAPYSSSVAGSSGYNYYDYSNSDLEKVRFYSPNSSLLPSNPNNFINPLCSVSLKDLVMCVMVVAYNSDFTAYTERAYNGYKVQDAANYPNIVQIYGIPYCRQSGGGDRVAMTIDGSENNLSGFARVNEYEIPDKSYNIIDYSACLSRDNSLKFHMWGIPYYLGRDSCYNSSNYVHIAVGQGGKFKKIDGGGSIVYYRAFNESTDWVLRTVASYGVFFTDRTSYAASAAYASANMRLGTIDSNGFCHGDYTSGSDNRDQPQYNWESTNESTYNPDAPLPPEYDMTDHFNIPSIANFNNYYVLNYNQVKDLVHEVYSALSLVPADTSLSDYSIETFLTNSPIDGIIKILRYPMWAVPNDGVSQAISIGAYTSGTISAPRYLNSESGSIITFKFEKSKRFNELYDGSFLDREPYTTAELYIPFCGNVPISVADYIGHVIQVKLLIDYKTGSCVAYILRDSTPLQSITGQIGVDIPVTGISAATVDAQLFHANMTKKKQSNNAVWGTFSGIARIGGSVVGLLSGNSFASGQAISTASSSGSIIGNIKNQTMDWENANYDLHHVQPDFKDISTGSPTCGAMGEYCCRLTIYRPIISPDYDADVYARTVGFACLINGQVKDFHGLTQGVIDLSGVRCTDAEKNLIATAFKQGVFLPSTW